MFRKIALTLFVLIAVAAVAIFAIASTRPATYHVERSTLTAASPSAVYTVLNDLHRFPEWSPWQKLDPAMKITHEGPASGVGAKYTWAGNKDVGEGRMTITESTPDQSVVEKLEFLKPWASTCDVHFTIIPDGDGSKVTWAMDGTNDMMAKVMSLFMSMDSMIGKDFDAGLANLKRLTDSAAPAAADTTASKSS